MTSEVRGEGIVERQVKDGEQEPEQQRRDNI